MLPELIRRAVTVKAKVVAADERSRSCARSSTTATPSGTQSSAAKIPVATGAAVSVGLVFAAELGRLAGASTTPPPTGIAAS
ncbi:3-dehydroquinate synthase domain protein [Mycobacterium xenopi 4042]|uniref:3-dehydroquinate synthase domain protein n=1 Tax=Mycobacterium xenopi 4042 TaxID=1299334 RepID=X7ZP19_MYCXE|nr:3-dehydroquinate synthase domain protein [Mycobacterium xenopi 4042]